MEVFLHNNANSYPYFQAIDLQPMDPNGLVTKMIWVW